MPFTVYRTHDKDRIRIGFQTTGCLSEELLKTESVGLNTEVKASPLPPDFLLTWFSLRYGTLHIHYIHIT